MKKARNLALAAITGIITISSLVNISTQISILKDAYVENRKWEVKNQVLEEKISELSEQVKYATQGAYLKEQARDLLGMGTPDDYWIVDKSGEMNVLFPEAKESAETPAIAQWLELFTK